MTLDEVRERVAYIGTCRHDDEAAHGYEDDLRHDVLVAISQGCADAAMLAAEALKTSDIDFARWCA